MVTMQAEDSIMLKSRIKIMIAEYELHTGTKFVKKNAAEKLDMKPQQFSALIAGRVFTTAEKMFILANMLGCKVDDLYEYEEEPK